MAVILIVEDEEQVRVLADSFLQAEGNKTLSAATIAQALALIIEGPHMSAFEGKADMTVCGNSLSRSLLGAKRTRPFALHMSANDPKRTCPRA
jgi:CheY-like chemotaxis protein